MGSFHGYMVTVLLQTNLSYVHIQRLVCNLFILADFHIFKSEEFGVVFH